MGKAPPDALITTAHYYAACRIVADAAAILGNRADADRYARLAEEIAPPSTRNLHRRRPLRRRRADREACALYYGLAEPSQRQAVAARLVAAIPPRRPPLCGNLRRHVRAHVLVDAGRADLAYSILTQTEFPSYGHWLKQGATTLWEAWDGSGSQNHIMFGDFSAWMYANLAGIPPIRNSRDSSG